MFTQGLRRRVQGRRALARHQDAGGQDLRVGRQVHLREESAVLRRHDHDAGAASATSRARACSRVLGDSVTTDHISPAGNISKSSPAAKYLMAQGVQAADFNSYGARRGNHEVMMRGTFANIRLRNCWAGHRGRRHRAHPERRADVDLRCRDEVQGARHAAGGPRAARNTARAARATGRPRARCCSA